jgi:dGTPase
MTKKGTW